MNNIPEARNHSSNTNVIYLDFRKAFDSVAHNELLYKLWKHGITGDLWLWFRAYQSSRTPHTKMAELYVVATTMSTRLVMGCHMHVNKIVTRL